MKLTILLLTAAFLQVSANGHGQTVTYAGKNVKLETVFSAVEQQTGYAFFYNDADLKKAAPVTLNLKSTPVQEALQIILKGQPFSYTITGKTIAVSYKGTNTPLPSAASENVLSPPIDIRGRIISESGEPQEGVSVSVKGTSNATASNANYGTTSDAYGNFELNGVDDNATLIITSTNIESIQVDVKGRKDLVVKVKIKVSPLNEIQVIGYGKTTRRFNTGSVSTVSSADIEKQPVTNILSALSGRAAGVLIQTTNGLPGGNVNVQVRGIGSIRAGTNPLYIIDGVPYPSQVFPNVNSMVVQQSIIGAPSPLNSLNPSDIESITVLKDADATSIYGSRGTNGVVLITTKQGKAGKTAVNLNISKGVTKVISYPKVLKLQQYLELRKEAFANDGKVPSPDPFSADYAPDLTVYSQTKETDWAKFMLGGTGHTTNAQLGVSGGNSYTNFNISGNYHRETTVLPGNNVYQRGGLFLSFRHRSSNDKFTVEVTNSYTVDNNQTVNPQGYYFAMLLPPNYPVFDSSGKYNWSRNNPVATLLSTNKTKSDNLSGNLSLNYKLTKELELKVSSGFNKINYNIVNIFPTASLFPGSVNNSNFAQQYVRSLILEPQLNYNKHFKKSVFAALLGVTYQNSVSVGQEIYASNYTNERLQQDIASAATIYAGNSYSQYKYASGFVRLTYNLNKKYIVNGTLRRDGSSRFGSGNQFGNFGSLGAAWLFGTESWVKENLHFLSFGKLRASWGVTGNDQINDYQFLSTYFSAPNDNYQGISGLEPAQLANANFHWETTKEFGVALETGLLKDRVLLSVEYYKKQSKDQLLFSSLPFFTGFRGFQANQPSVVQNTGWEFVLNTKNINSKSFTWSTNFNLTLPKNVLKSFENFSTSNYSQTLQLGYDITRIFGFEVSEINPETGNISYKPEPGNTLGGPYLFFTLGKRTPDFFGGIGNTISYKRWSLDVFGQFVKQITTGGLFYEPGEFGNNYSFVLKRWQKPGDVTIVPKASTTPTYLYAGSSANIFNSSYLSLKNVSLSYNLSSSIWLKKMGLEQLRVYAQGQNLYTWWNKDAPLSDPESGSGFFSTIPPMRAFTVGLQTNF